MRVANEAVRKQMTMRCCLLIVVLVVLAGCLVYNLVTEMNRRQVRSTTQPAPVPLAPAMSGLPKRGRLRSYRKAQVRRWRRRSCSSRQKPRICTLCFSPGGDRPGGRQM